MSKKISRTRFVLGTLAAIFLAAEPMMMLWQPLLPPGSYAAIATVCACVRAGLAYYMTTDVVEEKEEDNATTS